MPLPCHKSMPAWCQKLPSFGINPGMAAADNLTRRDGQKLPFSQITSHKGFTPLAPSALRVILLCIMYVMGRSKWQKVKINQAVIMDIKEIQKILSNYSLMLDTEIKKYDNLKKLAGGIPEEVDVGDMSMRKQKSKVEEAIKFLDIVKLIPKTDNA